MTDYRRLSKSQRRKVVAQNKGIITRAAKRAGVSQPFASMVFHGKSVSRKVRTALNYELRMAGVCTHEPSVRQESK